MSPGSNASPTVGIGHGRVMAGLAGRGIVESRSPWMHEQEAAAQGLHLAYALFDFTDRHWSDTELPGLLDAAQRIGFAGINITFPFKQAVIPLLDDLDPSAATIGAVNTIAFIDGRRIGYNTDYTGFIEGFRLGLPDVVRSTVLQIGCGGAGSATAHGLLGPLGVERLLLADSDTAKAELLCGDLQAAYGASRVAIVPSPAQAASAADGIVNATPMGMAKYPGLPLPAQAVVSRHWVAEIVYFPLETELLREARRKGCRVLDGSGMAVGQAADAFAIFTGKQANRERMQASFTAYVTERAKAAA